MDELDKKLYNDLNLEIEVPGKLKKIIKEELQKERKKETHYSFSKIVITACVSLLVTTGIVYAGTVLTNNIWKEPEKVIGFYSEENKNQNTITESERARAMSKTEAESKAKELLKKFGHSNETIKLIELDSNPNNYELIWHIETNNKSIIEFEAEKGKSFSVFFESVLAKNIDNYRTTEEKAIKTAEKLCEKYGYFPNKYSDIEIRSNLVSQKDAYIWYADFSKKYDDMINPFEKIKIGFIPEINEIYYFIVKDEEYDNNSIEVSKEQAEKIALDAEQQINTGYNIKSIYSNLDIAKMNGDAYARKVDYDQYYQERHSKNYSLNDTIIYRTDSYIRKVWMVTIEYDTLNKDNTNVYDEYYTYYIDVTTGEIIGGNPIYYMTRLQR
ncbi:MAG: hypothetical protein HFJ29_05055 [Clostridia bacterium]|nr:hypothetical protein [Clostridia bacterium]